jgi:hypothetical protein
MGMEPISSKKHGSAVRFLELAFPLLVSAGEGAFLMPEQLAFNERLGIAAQFTATNGPARRELSPCKVCASSSFPVPLSPVISTVTSVAATFCSVRYNRCIASLLPRICPYRSRSTTSRRNRVFSRSSL